MARKTRKQKLRTTYHHSTKTSYPSLTQGDKKKANDTLMTSYEQNANIHFKYDLKKSFFIICTILIIELILYYSRIVESFIR